mgnify:CR=1 FL=1
MHKSSSFNTLLGGGDGLQSRWRQTRLDGGFIRRKSKFRFHFVYLVATILLILIIYVSLPPSKKVFGNSLETPPSFLANPIVYNYTYPLTRPIVNPHNHHTMYRIGIIADLDTNSRKDKGGNSYSSYYKKGFLTVGPSQSTFEFKWDIEDSNEIQSGYALKGENSL